MNTLLYIGLLILFTVLSYYVTLRISKNETLAFTVAVIVALIVAVSGVF